MRTLLALPLLLLAASAAAQEPTPAPEPRAQVAPAPEPAPPRADASLTNVRIDLTLTDQSGTKPPVRKTMTLTLADGERGSVRSRPQVLMKISGGLGFQTLPLNVDARPILVGGRVKLMLTLEYSSAEEQPGADATPKAAVNFSGHVVLDSGRPMVVAEAADPVSDRRVTVEVKATILK